MKPRIDLQAVGVVPVDYYSRSVADTYHFGLQLGRELEIPTVVCLFGALGAGKTTLIKGLVEGACQLDASIVQSPTFTYLNIYEGIHTLYHFDLYRLRDIDEFLSMGFDEYFDAGGICCVEWSERIAPYFPADALFVTIEHLQEDQRKISLLYHKGHEGEGNASG